MSEQFKFVFDRLLVSFGDTDDQPLIAADTEHLVEDLIKHEFEVYGAAGAPYGNTVAGFLVWLESANRLTPSA
jgi:hypothetical protein